MEELGGDGRPWRGGNRVERAPTPLQKERGEDVGGPGGGSLGALFSCPSQGRLAG